MLQKCFKKIRVWLKKYLRKINCYIFIKSCHCDIDSHIFIYFCKKYIYVSYVFLHINKW